MYNDKARWWYEAYFLTRRTLFIFVSVGFQGYAIQRTVCNLTWSWMTVGRCDQCFVSASH